MSKEIEIKFTQEELLQLDRAIGNCWGHGDWLRAVYKQA